MGAAPSTARLEFNVSPKTNPTIIIFLSVVPRIDCVMPRGTYLQSFKLLRQLGMSCPVALGTSSRILRATPADFVLCRSFAVNCTLFGYILVDSPDFQHFCVYFGNFLTNFEHFLIAFLSSFLVN